MALVTVTHKPVTGKGRQFDGSLAAMTDILNARPKANVSATLTFDQAGAFVGLEVSGGALGSVVTLRVNDWAIFPDDTTQPAFAVPAGQASTDWQVT